MQQRGRACHFFTHYLGRFRSLWILKKVPQPGADPPNNVLAKVFVLHPLSLFSLGLLLAFLLLDADLNLGVIFEGATRL